MKLKEPVIEVTTMGFNQAQKDDNFMTTKYYMFKKKKKREREREKREMIRVNLLICIKPISTTKHWPVDGPFDILNAPNLRRPAQEVTSTSTMKKVLWQVYILR